jgi:hypothetical protein
MVVMLIHGVCRWIACIYWYGHAALVFSFESMYLLSIFDAVSDKPCMKFEQASRNIDTQSYHANFSSCMYIHARHY